MKKKTERLMAPCTGKTLPLSAVPDEVFAQGILGKGIAIDPTARSFFAPVSGEVTSVVDSLHAYTLSSNNGTNVLVHIGVDTVSLAGKGFLSHVRAGDRVVAGQLIAEADIDLIRSRGLSPICSLVVTEPEDIEDIEYTPGFCIGGEDVVMQYQVTVRNDYDKHAST